MVCPPCAEGQSSAIPRRVPSDENPTESRAIPVGIRATRAGGGDHDRRHSEVGDAARTSEQARARARSSAGIFSRSTSAAEREGAASATAAPRRRELPDAPRRGGPAHPPVWPAALPALAGQRAVDALFKLCRSSCGERDTTEDEGQPRSAPHATPALRRTGVLADRHPTSVRTHQAGHGAEQGALARAGAPEQHGDPGRDDDVGLELEAAAAHGDAGRERPRLRLRSRHGSPSAC